MLDDETEAPTSDTPGRRDAGADHRARLQRELAKERAVVAAQQTIIRALRAERDQERELRAKDRRLALAEQRIRRCSTLSATQRDVLVTVGRVAPALANTHDTDAPIITREMVGPGGNLKTTGEALKVLDLPGMPIQREAVRLGPARTVTAFKLSTRDATELLERVADAVEAIEERPRPVRKPTPLRCALHPEADPIAAVLCGHPGCARRLDGPDVAAHQADEAQEGENRPLADSGTLRGCTGTYEGEKRPLGIADSDELAERRARQAVGIPLGRAPDRWKQPAPPAPAHCRLCPSLELYQLDDGRWRCEGCGEIAGAATVRELAPGVIETVRDGETIIGRDPSLPPVDMDVTGYRSCCGTDGILRQRGGVWSCADCRAEVTA